MLRILLKKSTDSGNTTYTKNGLRAHLGEQRLLWLDSQRLFGYIAFNVNNNSTCGLFLCALRLRKYGKRFFKLTETGLKFTVIKQKGLRTALEIKKQKESAGQLLS